MKRSMFTANNEQKRLKTLLKHQDDLPARKTAHDASEPLRTVHFEDHWCVLTPTIKAAHQFVWAHYANKMRQDRPTFRRHKRRAPGPTSPRGAL
jgi:hypothetical protein